MSETPESSPPAKKVHWATQRKLDIEEAIREGREPPPSPFAAAREAAKAVAAAKNREVEKDVTPSKLHLEGLGPKNCPTACNPEKGCCVSGNACVHPSQCGLQPAHKMNPEIIRKYAEMVDFLKHLAIDRKS